MIKSDSISKLITALVAAQGNFDPVLKDKDNPFFKSKYADLAGVIEATEPALRANGLVVSQFPVSSPEGRVGVLTILAHESGEFIAQEYTLPIAKQDAQTGVAAVTYSRRAAYQGAIGVAAEDDDGNTAAGRNMEEQPSRRPTPAKERIQPIAQEVPVSQPPKAEIPFYGNPSPLVLDKPGKLPTKAEFEEIKNKVVALQKTLRDAGLKPSTSLPVNKKVLNYLYSLAGVNDAEKLSLAQWTVFFELMDKATQTAEGTQALIEKINTVAEGK